jgi:hypothetical protein
MKVIEQYSRKFGMSKKIAVPLAFYKKHLSDTVNMYEAYRRRHLIK